LEELIQERTDETIRWYLEDMGALGNLEPDFAPRATDYIRQMIDMTQELIDTGHAYEAEGHVLFDVTSYEHYGSLSGRSVNDMIAGARVEVAPYKRNPMDFVLWKPSTDDLPGWDSPWGRGRPGWHIECSAMTKALFGEKFDIHGGGLDLAFPHHENEKAQSCCEAGEDSFANFWMHNEMLQVEGKKMSKSLGNFFTVRDLLDGHDGELGVDGSVIRYVFLSTHYRKPMDWTAKKALDAELKLIAFHNLIGIYADHTKSDSSKVSTEVIDALSNDLNTHAALAHLDALATHTKRVQGGPSALQLAHDLKFLGLSNEHFGNIPKPFAIDKDKLSALERDLLSARKTAMQTKDFSEVDRLKLALIDAGVEVRMSNAGVELIAGPNFDPSKLEALK
jgi:cysteinyl-tRNA synthetase